MEFVFVTPREELFPACYPQGFHPFASAAEADLFLARAEDQGFFVERERAECTPAWKQLIPYCVVTQAERILVLRRRARGGEARLHGKQSIGVGGHVNPVDRTSAGAEGALVRTAAQREMREELAFAGEPALRLVGYLNDDSNPVGAVHLGLVFTANPTGPVHVREEDVLEGRMIPIAELRALYPGSARDEGFETWSCILISHLGELAPETERTRRPTATLHSTP